MTLKELVEHLERETRKAGFKFDVLQVHPSGITIGVKHKPKVFVPMLDDTSDHWHEWNRT